MTSLLISLFVIQTHSEVALNYCDQSIDSCCHSAAYDLYSQAEFLLWPPGSQSLWAAGDTHCILNSIQLPNVIQLVVPVRQSPFAAISHSTFAKVAGTFKVMGSIKYSCNFSNLKPEERCFFRNA